MKVGKLPENVLKRSVLKQIHTKRPEVCQGAAVGEDCAAICLAEDEMLVLSTDPITGTAIDIGSLSIAVTLNDLASAGAEPVWCDAYRPASGRYHRTADTADDAAGGKCL